MKKNNSIRIILHLSVVLLMIALMIPEETAAQRKQEVIIEAENLTSASGDFAVKPFEDSGEYVHTDSAGWIALDVKVPRAGRYLTEVRISAGNPGSMVLWVEDYYDNKDNRTYNITGNMTPEPGASGFVTVAKTGSPLNAGLHKMKIHFNGAVSIDHQKFTLLKPHRKTPKTLTQQTRGEEWEIAWADEFDGPEVDTTKWTFDFGNWGWGNHELQLYTDNRPENARIENGNLIIEARKGDLEQPWTSARLTTREKVSFLYGKIEFRAKVPAGKGNWAAGWTLGDSYIDELSWPYCGEIDILESVGYEMDNETGNGIAHASAHSGAYYFKLGNQPTATIPVKNMNNEYHTYAVEWTPEYIKAFVDGIHYFTYEDNSSELSWPFDDPHNIILNLAMGGGWGGAMGMDETVTSQKMVIDYVRVYQRK
ncbi:MAG: family 16 glycosylhydrolase [Bacteroidales bacterium]